MDRKNLKCPLDNAAAKNVKSAKKIKVKRQSNSNDFGNLKMASLKQYQIPTTIQAGIQEIEGNGPLDESYVSVIKTNVAKSISDVDSYFYGFRDLLYLNEAADSIFLREFNQKHIRISYSAGKTFKIQISVSIQIIT